MAQHIEGKVFTAADISKFPSRTAFLDQKKLAECRHMMANTKPLEFLPGHIWESYLPEDDKGNLKVSQYAFRTYKIIMFGIVPSGEKITVVNNGVMPFFEIRIPRFTAEAEKRKYIADVLDVCKRQDFKVKSHSVISGATVREYGDTAEFIVLKFSSIAARSFALKYFVNHNYETTHDDPTCYYRVLCRDNLVPWTNWVTLRNYRTVHKHTAFTTAYTLIVNHADIEAYQGDIFEDPFLKNDFTVEANFDIETFDSVQKNDIPQPENKTAEMFNISMAFCTIDGEIFPSGDPRDTGYHWAKPKGHLVYYLLTTAITEPMPGRVVVVCKDEREMIFVYAVIWFLMEADLAPNFNGDNYDWKWITERARQYGLLGKLEQYMSLANLEMLRTVENKKFIAPTTPFQTDGSSRGVYYQWWKKYTFKVAADLQTPGAYLGYPGYMSLDLMPQLRAMNNNPDKYGLQRFLEIYGLGDKVEMPYKEIAAMYQDQKTLLAKLRAAGPLADMAWTTLESRARELGLLDDFYDTARNMKRIGEYCIVDSLRCHDLLVKTQFVRDRRLIGSYSFTTMEDSIFRANGMKVRNIIYSKANQRNLHVSNQPPKKVEIGKYPGAYVFPPKKGIATAKPSPHEMRKSKDPKYAAWSMMSEEMYNKILDAIAKCGIWLENYLPAIISGSVEDIPADLLPLYEERAEECNMTLAKFVSTFRGDLVGEYAPCFIEWLKLDSHYPIAGLDFSSLYPSLIMAYNFSPEMMVHSLDRMLELKLQGKNVHPVSFLYNGRTIEGWSVRSQYPEKQEYIDQILKKLQSLTQEHIPENLEEELKLHAELEQVLCDVEFGLFPSVLKMLFDQRVGLKTELKPINHRKEEIELLPEAEFAKHAKEYADIMFKYNYLNSKQKALKVFMNTFYGEAGNPVSPLRVLALAGGVTSSGQYNIKKVAALVVELGCRIYYGDTDSVYISMPKKSFNKYDRAYYSQRGEWAYVLIKRVEKDKKIQETWEWLPVDKINGREHRDIGPLSKRAYFECLVTESFRQITIINKSVNSSLEADNGTKFLNMAFEEFLFPAAFFSKKKYCGIAHEGSFNANPKKIFVRGLEYVKRGVSQMLKDLSVDILWRVFGIDNIDPLIKIVENTIEEVYTSNNMDFEKFVKTATYKPNKKNVAVHTFHARMAALGIAPEPLDRFRYVIVKKYPYKYSLNGKQIELSVGDRMEYADRAQALGMEIDLDYYMSSGVCGQLARFISYEDRFRVDPIDDTDEAYQTAEKKNIAACKKYILGCYEQWSQKHESKGPAVRTLYTKISSVFHDEFSRVLNVSDMWKLYIQPDAKPSNDDKDKSQATYEQNQNMFTELMTKLEAQSVRESKSETTRFINNMKQRSDVEWIQMRTSYREMLTSRKNMMDKQLPLLMTKMQTKTAQLRKMFKKRDDILSNSIMEMQSKVGIDQENFDTLEIIIQRIKNLDNEELRTKIAQEIRDNVTHDDLVLLNDIDTLYLEMLSMLKIVKTTSKIAEEINKIVHTKLGDTTHLDQENHLDDLDDWLDEIGV